MFKRFIIPILAVAIAVPLVAQGTKRMGLGQRQGMQQGMVLGPGLRLNRLEKALNLTPDQVNSLKALIESSRPQIQAIAQQARDRGKALKDLMAQSNPNPTDLGNAMLALKSVREQAQQERQSIMNSFKSSLTADQQKTLEGLQTARKNLGGGRPGAGRFFRR